MSVKYLLCFLLCGCSGIPVKRTYSISYGDGKQSFATSVTFEPGYKK